jgi:Fe-S-cluster containining protein
MSDETYPSPLLPIDDPLPSAAPKVVPATPTGPLDPDLARGLVHIHEKLGMRILAEQQLTRHVYALTELLVGAGVVSLEELEERKKSLEQRMTPKARTRWSTAQVYEDVRDKYTLKSPPIDCASRIDVCKAACCRMSFHLGRQDLEENVVRWDVGRPFHIARRADGYCTHADPVDGHCQVHAHRPAVCREYGCRDDERIWKDFEARIPSDAVAAMPPLGAHATEDDPGR